MASAPVEPLEPADRPPDGHAPAAAPPPRWSGDDAVPRGLAVASAVILRVIIVVGGIVLLALFAKRMMVVVLPLIIAVLLATLLVPPARWLQRHRVRPGPAAFLVVIAAAMTFLGLWALVIPAFVSQVPDVLDNVQEGVVKVASVTEPLGISREEVQRAVDKAVASLEGGQLADQVLTGALLVSQWAAATILILVLTFLFVKDGEHVWEWIVCLFADHRRPVLREVGSRAWAALAGYVRGVFLVATVDAVLIGTVLLAVGVPIALPLIVLTFLAAFFPIVGSILAGVAAVLVTLVTTGIGSAVVVLAAIIVVQQLEGNVFYPMVIGPRLQLHAVAVLVALTAGAVLAGVVGAFLAIPVAAVISAVLDHVRTHRAQQRSHAVIAPP